MASSSGRSQSRVAAMLLSKRRTDYQAAADAALYLGAGNGREGAGLLSDVARLFAAALQPRPAAAGAPAQQQRHSSGRANGADGSALAPLLPQVSDSAPVSQGGAGEGSQSASARQPSASASASASARASACLEDAPSFDASSPSAASARDAPSLAAMHAALLAMAAREHADKVFLSAAAAALLSPSGPLALDRFPAQQAVDIAWVFARLDHHDAGLLECVSRRFKKDAAALRRLGVADICRLLSAFGHFRQRRDALFATADAVLSSPAALSLQQPAVVPVLSPAQRATLLVAFCRCGAHGGSRAFGGWLAAMESGMHELSASQRAELLQALQEANVLHDGLVQAAAGLAGGRNRRPIARC